MNTLVPNFQACSGLFEAHLTVMPISNAEQVRFVDQCALMGLKPIMIELPKGDVAVQLMTSSIHRGEIHDVFTEVQGLAAGLDSAGFPVARVKIEAAPGNPGVPLTESEAASFPASNYCEHHLKVLLSPGDSLDELRNICSAHQAHLSRNAFKRHPEGKSEQFITLRCYGAGLQAAQAKFEAMIDQVKAARITVLKQITEYCLFDDNISVDGNWGNQPELLSLPAQP
jgi:hypothetical protein